jgi:ATP-dependent DNA ligase
VRYPWENGFLCSLFHAAGLTRSTMPAGDDWLFELKYDGFRGLAHIVDGECRLVSRNGNTFKQFARLSAHLAATRIRAVLDGEIVCLDDEGAPVFKDLLFHRGEPAFSHSMCFGRTAATCGICL